MQAGRLDRRIRIESRDDISGGDAEARTYTLTAVVWAERLDARGIERYTGSQTVAEAAQGYRIRYRTDVTPLHRVLDGAQEWDIAAVIPSEKRGDHTVLVVERNTPNQGGA